MRSEEEIIRQIVEVANSNDRIRGVLLTGSRAEPNARKDPFQDFDVTYIVTQLDAFVKDKSWIDIFGERLILQMPEEMIIGNRDEYAFHYLMLLKDGNRIDLTLFPLEKLKTHFRPECFTVVLLDKDELFAKLSLPNDDHLIKRPTEKEFADCCNEFWWVSTYVGKGLFRKEITYAKQMMELPVRTMFLKMIEWYIGAKNGFAVPFGIGGRHMTKYISAELYNKILSTYPDSNIDNTWRSLFLMAVLFDELATQVASYMKLRYNKDEAVNVRQHLSWIQNFQTENKNA
ncbi:MAG TPA: aminoglycoside 6-adenylyltransferase [Chitinophagaceae bacterium]|nr:aminoglycoside 6-adenylyltransferase [Chitinophagaceae bacterium]